MVNGETCNFVICTAYLDLLGSPSQEGYEGKPRNAKNFRGAWHD
jgi:hypothetical protein